jgi:hypothetical protein
MSASVRRARRRDFLELTLAPKRIAHGGNKKMPSSTILEASCPRPTGHKTTDPCREMNIMIPRPRRLPRAESAISTVSMFVNHKPASPAKIERQDAFIPFAKIPSPNAAKELMPSRSKPSNADGPGYKTHAR